MAYNAVTKKAQEFTSLQDHELFSICFDGLGNDHVITELIRRYIVLRDTWAAEEKRMLEAQQAAKRSEAEWKEKHAFSEVRVCAITLRSSLTEAISEANNDIKDGEDPLSTKEIKLFDLKGNILKESLYVESYGDGIFIDLDFKKF